MSYIEWGYIGYGIDLYEIKEDFIDLDKIKSLFKENRYNVNSIFMLDSKDLQYIQEAQNLEDILSLKRLEYYESRDNYNYDALTQIIVLILNKLNYGFEGAEKDQQLTYIYLPACMPWEISNIKDLTKDKLKEFVNEALKEIYKEEYYDKIPQVCYINCVSGG